MSMDDIYVLLICRREKQAIACAVGEIVDHRMK